MVHCISATTQLDQCNEHLLLVEGFFGTIATNDDDLVAYDRKC